MRRRDSAIERREDDTVDRFIRAIDDQAAGSSSHVPAQLVEEFVGVVQRFSDRRNISCGAWLDIGVPAEVLAQAGIIDRCATSTYGEAGPA